MEEFSLRIGQKLHKITHNSIKSKGSTPILTNLGGVHQRNIHTYFEGNLCSGLREEVEKVNDTTTTMDTGWSLESHSLMSVAKKGTKREQMCMCQYI